MNLRTKLIFKTAQLYFTVCSAYERMRYGVSLNVVSSDLWVDPYPHHSKMRESRPIHYSAALRAYWITRFDWVQEVLMDKRFGADVRKYPARVKRILKRLDDEQLEVFDNPSMLDLDPPDHSRIRRLVTQGFMSKFVNSLEPRIREIVVECLQSHDNEKVVDFVEVLAKPLPAIVIAEMMGLPASDHDQFRAWSEDLIEGSSTNDTRKLERSRSSAAKLRACFKEVIRDKRGSTDDDLITRLIAAEEEGDKLSEMELYNTCFLLLIAGHETTTRLISNGLYLLLDAPDQLALLRDDPSLIPQAVEEMLRYEPPVQATRRFVTEDVSFHGTELKKGDMLFLSIAGSNRDPRANDNPDTFDITRNNPQQIAFGHGIHLCLGAALARLEAKVAFEEILERYDEMVLVDEKPTWGTNAIFRGLETLNVRTS